MRNKVMKNFPEDETEIRAFQKALREWFLRERREMPWRSERSVYRTVVSEFMLQQTQVDTVRPYFENWVKKWKDFDALAAAGEAEVLRAWEGLGYYSRARNLHALAREISASGKVPESADAWLAFRGVGSYTAAAIASIAQGVPAAVVDGNVVRILSRLSADATAFKDNGAGVKYFSALADKMLSREHPGDHNEAMMELGATVCTKHNPRCEACPVAKFCRGKTRDDIASLPRFSSKVLKKVLINRVLIRFADGSILLCKPSGKTRRLRELFELPRWEEIFPGVLPNAAQLLLEGRRGIASESISERIYAGTLPEDFSETLSVSGSALFRIAAEDLERVTLSGPHRKWLRKLL